MFPYLIISVSEFKKVFKLKLHPLRYLRALIWYAIIGVIAYYGYHFLSSKMNNSEKNFYVSWIYYIFVISVYFFKTLSIAISSNIQPRFITKDEEFITDIAVLIACHNSEDILPNTLKNLLYTFLPEQIYIADNNNSPEPMNTNTIDVCNEYNVNYNYHPIGNKGNALNKTLDVINKKYKYILTLDDDTLLPEDFSPNKDFFDDEKVSSVGFGIKIKDKNTLSEKMADFEYKLNSLRDYVKNDTTNFFIIGIAGLWRREIFHKIISINPTAVKDRFCGKTLDCYEAPHGEDSYNGLISRLLGYKQMMDLNNFVETYAPPRFFYSYDDIFCNTKCISGYNSLNHYSQRALRWYRSHLSRLPYETFLFFTYNCCSKNDNLKTKIFKQIKYRFEFIWKNLIIYFTITLFMNMIGLILNGFFMKWVYIHVFSFILGVFSNSITNYIIFRNRPDLQVGKLVILLYPFFTTYVTLCRLAGFFGAITFHIPFRTPFYFSFLYQIKKDVEKQEDVEKTMFYSKEEYIIDIKENALSSLVQYDEDISGI